jgi:pimeloyl-ACP methyl ester carboxylesterase
MTGSPAAILARHDAATIAYRRRAGQTPGVVFLPGLRSDMNGVKALFIDDYCRRRGRACVRFDYLGHGESSGDFAGGTIGRWAEDAIAVVDSLTEGPQILIGSSMGGWIMLLAALARRDRVKALVGIAAAPDFTADLFWARLDQAQQRQFRAEGTITLPSDYDPAGYTYHLRLFEEAAQHLLLGGPIRLDCPVRLLHGMADASVPWQRSLDLAARLTGPDVAVTLVKGGDHRLSTPPDLARLGRTLEELLA